MKTRLSWSVPLCAGMALATPVLAQQGQGPIEEIVVTGSYIKRSTFDSPSPIDFISQQDFAKQGAISVKDIVQNLPYNIGSENFPDTARSGATTGMESINLRGLGINSTLVLVNGRRQAEAPQLNNDGIAFVDTASIIPTIAIERMEVLKDGASALYGSDAISGVVNFITRNNFEGFEVSYDYQTITEYNEDRPRDAVVQAIAGFGNDRGHVVVAGSWLDRNRMPFHERDFTTGTGISATGTPGTFTPTRGPSEPLDQFDARRLAFRATTFLPNKLTPTGALAYQGADLDCANVPHASGRTPTSFLQATGVPGALPGAEACLFDFFPTQSLLDKERRLQLWSHFEFNLIPEHDVQLYGEIQTASNSIDRGNSTSYGFVIQPIVPIENPGLRNDFVRRGLAPNAIIDDAAAVAAGFANAIAAAQALAADPFALGATPYYIGPMLYQGRPYTDIPERYTKGQSIFDNTGDMSRDKTHIVLGVSGNIPFLDGWTFDVANTWSEHKFDGFSAYDTNDPNMQAALRGFGGRDCNPNNSPPGTGNCYFFNPYGSAYLTSSDDIGPNGLFNRRELWEYMFDPLLGNSAQELWVVDAVATGNIFELPAGAVGMAVGAQYRDQRFSSMASGTSKNFDFSFTVGGEPFGVARDVWAVFTEFAIPITGPDSAIGAMEFNTAIRYEDYGGGTGDTTDPKFALLWQPFDSLALRATWQTSFKAPGLAQLGGSSTSLNNVQSNPFVAGSPNQFIPGIATGNPNLTPETADVWNVGFTWEPEWSFLAGLSISVDHWSFEFEDAIRKEANATVVADCIAESGNNPNNVSGPKCSKITFNPDNTIAVIRSNFVNSAAVDTRGIDVVVRYPLPWEDLGQFTWFWNSSHITRYQFQESPTSLVIDGLGSRNFQTIGAPAPNMRGNTGFDWMMGNHSANITVRYVDDYDLGKVQRVVGGVPVLVDVAPNTTIALLNGRSPSRQIDSQWTVDMQYSYQVSELRGLPGPTLTFGLINAFNEDPPTIDDGPGYDTKIHDPRGRIAYGRITVAF